MPGLSSFGGGGNADLLDARGGLEIFLSFSVLVVLLVNLLLTSEPFGYREGSLSYKDNVKAALFALAAAVLMVVSWIPGGEDWRGVIASLFNCLMTMITGLLTGWYWLAGSVTKGTPEQHLVSLLVIVLAGVAVVVVNVYFLFFGYVFLSPVVRWSRRRVP